MTRQEWRVLALAWAGTFVVIMDATIVSVALPDIRAGLGFSAAALSWVVNAYTLAFAGLLLGGRLSDVFGQRRVFVAGMGLFVARLAWWVRRVGRTAPGGTGGAGYRRRVAASGDAVAADHHVHRAAAPRPRAGDLERRRRRGRGRRAGDRRGADPRGGLALGVLRQRADRGGGRRRCPVRPAAADMSGRTRPAGPGGRRDVRGRAGRRGVRGDAFVRRRLDRPGGARIAGRRARAARGVRAAPGALGRCAAGGARGAAAAYGRQWQRRDVAARSGPLRQPGAAVAVPPGRTRPLAAARRAASPWRR